MTSVLLLIYNILYLLKVLPALIQASVLILENIFEIQLSMPGSKTNLSQYILFTSLQILIAIS